MRTRLFLKKSMGVAIGVLWLCLGAGSLAETSESNGIVADRADMVRTLLFESSAARRIEESNDAAAVQKRADAIELYERALTSDEQMDRDSLLNLAVAKLYEAVALVKDSSDKDHKERSDFDNRKESFDALLAAHERIMIEKGTPGLHARLVSEIEDDSVSAGQLLAGGNPEAARLRLDRAYGKIMQSVERSRSGETLTRELKFESPSDEYLYEVDRNDTHRMLVTILLEEKLKIESIKQRVEPLIESADQFRAAAATRAAADQFEDATRLMEQSTSELVKAIRMAGVYIPG